MISTAAHHLGAMFWLDLRGNFLLFYIRLMCMYQPPNQLNFSKQMLESLERTIYSRGRSGSAIYIFTQAETIFNAVHNTFTGPEHPLQEECTLVILCLINKRSSESVFPSNVFPHKARLRI